MGKKQCKLDYCDKPHAAKGYCSTHYRQVYRYGMEPRPIKVKNPVVKCSLEYCDKIATQIGYCGSHYAQVHRYGIEPRPVMVYGEANKKCAAPWCERRMPNSELCIPCYKRRRRYGLSVNEYIALPQSCEACGSRDRLHVDHDHATGAYRGVLCGSCNSALGFLLDDSIRVASLAEYARRNHAGN